MYLVQMFVKVQLTSQWWILPCGCVKSHCENSDYVQKQREHLDLALASDNENYLICAVPGKRICSCEVCCWINSTSLHTENG